MIWIYAAAALFGGTFLIPMLLGGLDTDSGEIDFDTGDLDAGPDGDIGASDIGAGPLGAIFASLVSFRTIVFFSAFFGTAGLAFSVLGYRTLPTLATALLIGVVAALANSALFGLLRNSQTNSQVGERTLEGRPARVVLPMEGTTKGRIRVDLAGQPQFLVARPFADDGHRFEIGDPVVVVSFERGTALVASLAELDDGLGPDQGPR